MFIQHIRFEGHSVSHILVRFTKAEKGVIPSLGGSQYGGGRRNRNRQLRNIVIAVTDVFPGGACSQAHLGALGSSELELNLDGYLSEEGSWADVSREI